MDSDFKSVIQRICDGSEDAVWEFIEAYGHHTHRVARRKLDEYQALRQRFDSQDFVQMVWASFFTDRETISRFTEPTELVRYLAQMARNKIISEQRRTGSRKWGAGHVHSLESVRHHSEPLSSDPTPSQLASVQERVDDLIGSGNERDRHIIQLRLSGMTFEEIGLELGISERTARRAIWRLVSEEEEESGEGSAVS